MMEQAISLFPETTDSTLVYESAKLIHEEVIEKNQIRKSAIEAIHRHFDDGLSIVFATTSYLEAGLSLLEVLENKSLITSEMRKKIFVSGTEVNWNSRKIVHFNMSDGKLEGVAKILNTNVKAIRENTLYAYGDDPHGNDSGILSAAEYSFVIHTAKNASLEINKMWERIQW